ncbi:MAG TPA: hypothetical protein VI111_11470 [Thermoleophilaceae bacterium]
MNPSYEQLVELAERERDLIAAGRFDDLAALDDERGALVDTLPAVPPAQARPALERAAALQEENTRSLAAALVETRHGLLDIRRGRRTARSYAPQLDADGALLDTRAS